MSSTSSRQSFVIDEDDNDAHLIHANQRNSSAIKPFPPANYAVASSSVNVPSSFRAIQPIGEKVQALEDYKIQLMALLKVDLETMCKDIGILGYRNKNKSWMVDAILALTMFN